MGEQPTAKDKFDKLNWQIERRNEHQTYQEFLKLNKILNDGGIMHDEQKRDIQLAKKYLYIHNRQKEIKKGQDLGEREAIQEEEETEEAEEEAPKKIMKRPKTAQPKPQPVKTPEEEISEEMKYNDEELGIGELPDLEVEEELD